MRYGRYFSFLNITILFLKLFKFTQNNVKTYFIERSVIEINFLNITSSLMQEFMDLSRYVR